MHERSTFTRGDAERFEPLGAVLALVIKVSRAQFVKEPPGIRISRHSPTPTPSPPASIRNSHHVIKSTAPALLQLH